MDNSYIGCEPHYFLYHTKYNVLLLLFVLVTFLEASLYPYNVLLTSIIRSLIDNVITVLLFACIFGNSQALSAQRNLWSIFARAMFIVNIYKIPIIALFHYFDTDPTELMYLWIFLLYEACVHVFVYSVLTRQRTTIQTVVIIFSIAKLIVYFLKPNFEMEIV